MSETSRPLEPVEPDPKGRFTVDMTTAGRHGKEVVEWVMRQTRGGEELVRGILGKERHSDVGDISRVEVDRPDDTVGPRFAYDLHGHTETDPDSDAARRRIILRTVIGGAAVLGGALLAKMLRDILRDQDD